VVDGIPPPPNPLVIPMFNDPAVMASIFRVLVHLSLASAALSQILLIAAVVWKFSPRRTETIMRSAAAVCGLLLYLGAKALGLTLPEFLLYALTQSGSYLTGLIGALVPALTGFLCAWYVTRYFNSRNERKNIVGMRVLALVMTIVFHLFIDTYIATFDATHHEDFKLLLPNLTFVLAVLLYAVFKYHPLQDEPSTQASG
jgi:hypothetical protein